MRKACGLAIVLILVCGVFTRITFGADSPNFQGSGFGIVEEALWGHVNGAPLAVFPSVLNDTYIERGDFSSVRFYYSPVFLTIKPTSADIWEREDEYICDLRVITSNNRVKIAARYLAQNSRNFSDYRLNDSNVMPMPLNMATYSIEAMNNITVEPKGGVDTGGWLPKQEELLTVHIPKGRTLDEFLHRAERGSFTLNANLFFEGKDVRRFVEVWNASKLKNTTVYREIKQSGATFVTSKQFNDLLQEVKANEVIVIYQDTGIDKQLTAETQRIFDAMKSAEMDLYIRNTEEAKLFEEEQRKALVDFKREDYFPLVAVWDIVKLSAERPTREDANNYANEAFSGIVGLIAAIATENPMIGIQAASATYNAMEQPKEGNKGEVKFSEEGIDILSYLKKFVEVKQAITSEKQDWDALNAGKEISDDKRPELAKSDTKKLEEKFPELFPSDSVFEKYREYVRQHGQEFKITARGLDLVRKEKFLQDIESTTVAIAIEPRTFVRKRPISSNLVSEEEVKGIKDFTIIYSTSTREEMSHNAREVARNEMFNNQFQYVNAGTRDGKWLAYASSGWKIVPGSVVVKGEATQTNTYAASAHVTQTTEESISGTWHYGWPSGFDRDAGVRVTVSFTEFREIEDPIPQKITETLDITSGERYVQLPGNTKGINSVEVILSDDKKIILTTPEPSNGFYYEYNPTTKGIVLRMIQ